MSEKKLNEEQRLEAAHAEAEIALSQAWDEFSALSEEVEEVERDLAMRDRWMRAWLGSDLKLREELQDCAEYQLTDPGELQNQIVTLIRKLTAQRAALKEVSAKHESAKVSEWTAYYGLQRFRHRRAVIAMLRCEVELGRAFQTERTIRLDVAGREGSSTGSFACMQSPVFGTFNISDRQSQVSYRLKNGVEMGFLDGREDWLPSCNFMSAGTISTELLVQDIKDHRCI